MAEPENPASTERLMEAICDPDYIETALRAVVRNKGAPGVDGITIKQLPGILKARRPEIEDSCSGALPSAASTLRQPVERATSPFQP
jgi:hypothetical protein